MYSRLLVLAVCLASVTCDRFQDYNKFPNRRFGDPTNTGYDDRRTGDALGYGGRTTYDGSSTYDSRSGYGTGGGAYGTGGVGYGTGGAAYGTGGVGYGTGGAGYGTGAGYTGYDEYGADGYGGRRDYCRNRTAQTDIRMDELMGMWYGVEIIPHLVGNPGTYMDDTCVVIHIAEVNEPSTESSFYYSTLLQRNWSKDYRHLRLVWDEAGRDVEYSLYFRRDAVGFWNSEAEQNGTLPTYRSYKPFSGTVQVLKAVNDHLLLHFCQPATEGRQAQLFSVLLSREPRRLERWEVESAHDLLRRKNLSITTRRLVCGNSAAALLPSLFVAFALLVAALPHAL